METWQDVPSPTSVTPAARMEVAVVLLLCKSGHDMNKLARTTYSTTTMSTNTSTTSNNDDERSDDESQVPPVRGTRARSPSADEEESRVSRASNQRRRVGHPTRVTPGGNTGQSGLPAYNQLQQLRRDQQRNLQQQQNHLPWINNPYPPYGWPAPQWQYPPPGGGPGPLPPAQAGPFWGQPGLGAPPPPPMAQLAAGGGGGVAAGGGVGYHLGDDDDEIGLAAQGQGGAVAGAVGHYADNVDSTHHTYTIGHFTVRFAGRYPAGFNRFVETNDRLAAIVNHQAQALHLTQNLIMQDARWLVHRADGTEEEVSLLKPVPLLQQILTQGFLSAFGPNVRGYRFRAPTEQPQPAPAGHAAAGNAAGNGADHGHGGQVPHDLQAAPVAGNAEGDVLVNGAANADHDLEMMQILQAERRRYNRAADPHVAERLLNVHSRLTFHALRVPLSNAGVQGVKSMVAWAPRNNPNQVFKGSNDNFVFEVCPFDQGGGGIGTPDPNGESHPLEFFEDGAFNERYWSSRITYSGLNGRTKILTVAARTPRCLIHPNELDAHAKAEQTIRERMCGHHGGWVELNLWNAYAWYFILFQNTPIVISAKRQGWKPIFLLKCCITQKVEEEYSKNGVMFSSCDGNGPTKGKSVLLLLGFYRHDVATGREEIITTSYRDQPLAYRSAPVNQAMAAADVAYNGAVEDG